MRHLKLLRWIAAVALAGFAASLSGCAETNLDGASALSGAPTKANRSSAYETGSVGKPDEDESWSPGSVLREPESTGPKPLFRIENPTLADVLKSGPLPERTLGRPDAPVTVIKYMSLTCPICSKWQDDVFPEFRRTYIDTGKVRLIFREFPIGRSSGNATIALRCAGPEKFLQLYELYLKQQSRWVAQEVKTDAIFAVAQQVGLSRAKFDACMADKEMIAGLQWVKERGRLLRVIGTPNFYINTKLYKSALDMTRLRAEIDPLLAARSVGAAGTAAQP